MAPGLTSESYPSSAPTKQNTPHIFAPLSADEIKYASSLIYTKWPKDSEFYFKTVTLEEPIKSEAIKYIEAEHNGEPLPSIDRRAMLQYYISKTNKFYEAIVNLSTHSVDRNVLQGKNVHASASGEEVMTLEHIVLNDPKVKEAIAKLELPAGTKVVCDPWPYGSDGVGDDERLWQCFMYISDPNEDDFNHYALPLAISPVIDGNTREVIRVDYVPTGKDNTIKEPGPWKIHPPNEYLSSAHKLRTDLKPLQVVQPEGTSFTVTKQGELNTIDWQKWNFKVGFNQREGIVLYDVRYDGRGLFYRISLSDMNIPYADPRHPFHKKSAFDLGDAGAGIMANNLKLGCDCLGSIHYLSGVLSNEEGGPLEMPNAVCIHEQDNGLLWKHTNYRTGRAALVRNRELVLQSIITVANYEYILAFQFNQAGDFMYEVRATGILSTQAIDEGVSVNFGTVVHPGVLATHHQHTFSLRIDPMIDDSHANRLVYEEAIPMPRSATNPHGNGYYTEETVIEKSGGYDLAIEKNRTFKIQNVNKRNPINGKPVAYKIMVPEFQKILSDKDSFNYKRSEFSDRNIYAVKYNEDELFSGGKYTNQSRGGTGVRSWASREDTIVDDDLVVFVQFGINHIPRIEDFPVMPAEIIKVHFRPSNFFDKNPAIDVPPSTQQFNQSTAVSGQHHQPATIATVDGSGCCSTGN